MELHVNIDINSAAIIAACGVLSTLLVLLNNVWTAIGASRAKRNGVKLDRLHDCLEEHRAHTDSVINARADISDALTVAEGEKHA